MIAWTWIKGWLLFKSPSWTLWDVSILWRLYNVSYRIIYCSQLPRAHFGLSAHIFHVFLLVKILSGLLRHWTAIKLQKRFENFETIYYTLHLWLNVLFCMLGFCFIIFNQVVASVRLRLLILNPWIQRITDLGLHAGLYRPPLNEVRTCHVRSAWRHLIVSSCQIKEGGLLL